MPLATCHRCQAVFIVDHDEQDRPRHLCPYCGRDLEPLAREDVERRIRRRHPDPQQPDEDGADARAGRVLPLLAARRISRSLDLRIRPGEPRASHIRLRRVSSSRPAGSTTHLGRGCAPNSP